MSRVIFWSKGIFNDTFFVKGVGFLAVGVLMAHTSMEDVKNGVEWAFGARLSDMSVLKLEKLVSIEKQRLDEINERVAALRGRPVE
jgi:hypothetical protein